MQKHRFNKITIARIIQDVFPGSEVIDYQRFPEGLVSSTYRVWTSKPSRTLVVKLGSLKRKNQIHKNNLILNYLSKNNIPAPKVYFDGIMGRMFITVMEYSKGYVAISSYRKAGQKHRQKILSNAGANLKKIHRLELPCFWVHQRHEIRSQKDWKSWTQSRIMKYLIFFRRRFKDYIDFLEMELKEFWDILKDAETDLVPLHWDYHLSNFNVDSKGEIKGIFDFDNAMKGHSLADIGQTAYWIRFSVHDSRNFNAFLKGYKRRFSRKELKMIRGYYILHLLAVSRSIWYKKRRLAWIIDEHKKILEEMIKDPI